MQALVEDSTLALVEDFMPVQEEVSMQVPGAGCMRALGEAYMRARAKIPTATTGHHERSF